MVRTRTTLMVTAAALLAPAATASAGMVSAQTAPRLSNLSVSPGQFTDQQGATISYHDSQPGSTVHFVVLQGSVVIERFQHRDRKRNNDVRLKLVVGGQTIGLGFYTLQATPQHHNLKGETQSTTFEVT